MVRVGNCHENEMKKNYLRFLSARLFLVESPHCFLLGGPTLAFTAPVTFDLAFDFIKVWLVLSPTLSGLIVTVPV